MTALQNLAFPSFLAAALFFSGCAAEPEAEPEGEAADSAVTTRVGGAVVRYHEHSFSLAPGDAPPPPFTFKITAGRLRVLLSAEAASDEVAAFTAERKSAKVAKVILIKCASASCNSGSTVASEDLTLRSNGLLQVQTPEPDALDDLTLGGTFAVKVVPLSTFGTSTLKTVRVDVTASW